MRHLIGIGLAVVISAAIFFGGGWAFNRLFTRNLGAEWSLPAGGGNFMSNSVVTAGWPPWPPSRCSSGWHS